MLASWQLAVAGAAMWDETFEDAGTDELMREYARHSWVADAMGVLRTLGVFARLVWHRPIERTEV
jgi:hypothetical protein